jgi:hypothetical protein
MFPAQLSCGADKPFRSVAANFSRAGMEHIHASYLYLNLAVFQVDHVDVWLSKNYEQIAFAGVLQFIGHVQVGIHPGL